LEEYADTEVAMKVVMNVFRPILFPLMAGKPSDIEGARKGFQEDVPKRFDPQPLRPHRQPMLLLRTYVSWADLAFA